ALVVEVATDNRNRITPQVRGAIEKAGGTFASPGAVSWMFKEQGLVTLQKEGKTFDEIFEAAVEAGAEDVEDAGDVVEVFTKPSEVEKVKNVLAGKGLTVQSAEIFKKPTTVQAVADANMARKVLALIEKLEDLEDVQKVYANFDIADEILAKVQN
ncbi:MAG: transcriptional regulator, partial [Candidatus Woesebacteria bacterium GW2011_GWA1_39_8]